MALWTESIAYLRTVTPASCRDGVPGGIGTNASVITDGTTGTSAAFGNGVSSDHTYIWGWTVDLGADYDIERVTVFAYGTDWDSAGNDQGNSSPSSATTTHIGIAIGGSVVPMCDIEALEVSGSWAANGDGWTGGTAPNTGATFIFSGTETGRYVTFFKTNVVPPGLTYFHGLSCQQLVLDATPHTEPPPPPIDPGVHFSVDGVEFDNLLEAKIRVELNAPGAGYMVLSKGDPQAIPSMVYRGAIVQASFPEIHSGVLFEFFLEDGDFDVISGDEEGGEELRFGGPGTLSILRRAIVRSEEYLDGIGYPKPNKGVWVFDEGNTEGHIINKLIREAQAAARPAHPLAGVTKTFDADDDSNGQSWHDQELEGKWRIKIGTNLYDAVLRLVNSGLMYMEMYPGLVLYCRRTTGTDRTTGAYATGKIRFVKGENIADELTKELAGQHFATHAEVKYLDNDDDIHYINATKDAGDFSYDKEIYLEVEASHANTARRQAKHAMKLREDLQDAIELAHKVPWPGKVDGSPVGADIVENADELNGWYLPGPAFADHGSYWLGDVITLHTGVEAEGASDFEWQNRHKRVYAITLQMDATGHLDTPIVELNAPRARGSNSVLQGISGTLSATGTGSIGGSTGGGSGIPTTISGGLYQLLGEKGDPDGYAALDSGGQVPADQVAGGTDSSGYIPVAQGDGTVVWEASTAASIDEPVEVINPATGTISTIDYDTARVWDLVLSGNVVIGTILNPPPSGQRGEVWLNVYGDGSHTVTAYPAAFEWQDTDGSPTATPPALYTAADSRSVLHGITHDGGITWGFALDNAASTTPAVTVEIGWVLDGGGNVLSTGNKRGLRMEFGCTLTGWAIGLDTGTITVDIWKDVDANFPPTVADTITAAAKPAVSSGAHGSSTTLTGWITTVSAGDWLYFNIDAVSGATFASIILKATRT